MDATASGFEESSGLPDLGSLDTLNQLWRQGTGSAPGVQGNSQSTGLNMSEVNGASNASPVPQAVDLEATPDLEVKIRVVYADARVKNLEGSLNPLRTVQQLKGRLANQLNIQPHLLEMSWRKLLNNGDLTPPTVLDNARTLIDHEVESDDMIILRELPEN